MTREAWILGLAGVCFGLLIGWIIGSQSARPVAMPSTPAVSSTGQSQGAQAPAASAQSPNAAPLDEAQVQALSEQAKQRPQDAGVRTQLGNLFFDAERYADAIKWYEASLAIQPRNADVSTDLAVSYYYTNQTDRALRQFEASLAVDPRHTKTLLNLGMVKAFGKQDLAGAAQAWQSVLQLAPPESPEARTARQALESLKAAHPEAAGAVPPAKGGV
jgi:cytochrome c-type biogenesis protein CcmH/NrfG